MEVRGARGSNDLREKHLVAQSGEILGAEGRVWSEKRKNMLQIYTEDSSFYIVNLTIISSGFKR